ncbi:MAG: hypothetical protein ABII02_01210 [Candidatus Magasanikbacteria bacterium]
MKYKEEQVGFRGSRGPFIVSLTEDGRGDEIFSGIEEVNFNEKRGR